MSITVSSSPEINGQAAACGAGLLRETLARKDEAYVIVATSASQFETLKVLLREPDIAWEEVTFFHLDEYVGLPPSIPPLPASTSGAASIVAFQSHLAVATTSPAKSIPGPNATASAKSSLAILSIFASRVSVKTLTSPSPVPPADFATEQPYVEVKLDEAIQRYFPAEATSKSVRQIMKSLTKMALT